MNNTTEPPCNSCLSHDSLEKKVRDNMKNNSDEHIQILSKINDIVINLKWMKIIGNWILFTLFGYLIAIGIFIFTNDFVSVEEANKVKERIGKGEILHYRNEKMIERVNTQLEFIVDHMKRETNEN